MSAIPLAKSLTIEPLASLKLPGRKTVSVIVPCYNEERFIGKALTNLASQYAASHYEIIVIDGISEDSTREVVNEFKETHPEIAVTLIENPARNIPVALNLGINAARGEIIARMDAHAVPSPGYIRRCVEVLEDGDADIVGMPCRIKPGATTNVATAIAAAVSHPFGIGDAKYRLGSGAAEQEEVDTVAFACFRKSLWVELNGFEEKLLTNEDYDFNYRARQRGYTVLLDHFARCDYFARPTLGKLASQYFRYGYWKAQMIKNRPESIRLRQTVAPAFVISILALMVSGLWLTISWPLLGLELAVYVAAAGLFAFRMFLTNRTSAMVTLLMPPAFLTIHLAWGASFLLGLVTPRRK